MLESKVHLHLELTRMTIVINIVVVIGWMTKKNKKTKT